MNSKFIRSLAFIFIAASVVYGSARLYYRLTDDFRLANITHDLSKEKGWKLPRLPIEEEKATMALLDQPYHYIGKGAQCYAFESDDHLYVLKFFKFKHLRPIWLVRILPSVFPFTKIKAEAEGRKRKKLHSVFDGYELAYREHKKEAELLYLHLQPTDYLNKQVTVYDKLGLEHNINLDEVVFLLQKKGETLRTRMNRQLKNGDLAGAKNSIALILTMYVKEYEKGLYDRDHGVMHNTGFIPGDLPFHLDVGKFSKDDSMRDPEVFTKDLEHIAWKIDLWIKNNYSEYYPELSSFIAAQFLELTERPFDVKTINPNCFKKKKR